MVASVLLRKQHWVCYIVVMGEVVEATWFRLQPCMYLSLENSSSAQCALRTGGNFSKFNDITRSFVLISSSMKQLLPSLTFAIQMVS